LGKRSAAPVGWASQFRRRSQRPMSRARVRETKLQKCAVRQRSDRASDFKSNPRSKSPPITSIHGSHVASCCMNRTPRGSTRLSGKPGNGYQEPASAAEWRRALVTERENFQEAPGCHFKIGFEIRVEGDPIPAKKTWGTRVRLQDDRAVALAQKIEAKLRALLVERR
jgi:hypothetical protein